MENPSLRMLMNVLPEWEKQYENLEAEKKIRWSEFNKKLRINLPFEYQVKLAYERGGIIKTGNKSELKKFDESKNGQLFKMFCEQNEKFLDEAYILGLLIAPAKECITSNGTTVLLNILNDIKIANVNISNSNNFDSKYKSKFLLLFDAISEKYNFLAPSVNKIFRDMELASNAKFQEFCSLLPNKSDFNKTFSALKDYWDGSQNLHQYVTFFDIVYTSCNALADENPKHEKECLKFSNQCYDVHESKLEIYFFEDIQFQKIEKMLTELLDGKLNPNSRENFQILMNAKNQWEVEYEKFKKYAESLIAEFNAENNCNFTFDDYNEIVYKTGLYFFNDEASIPEFFQFQNSKGAQLCQQVAHKLKQNKNYSNMYCHFINYANKLNSNSPDFYYVIKNLKATYTNPNFTQFLFEEKICIILILDAILEMTNGQLALQVIPLFTRIEINSNKAFKNFYNLCKNNGTFEETFVFLQNYLNENKVFHKHITFCVCFIVFCETLAEKYPKYAKKCIALRNKCNDVCKYAREEYLREENIRNNIIIFLKYFVPVLKEQQKEKSNFNNIPPMFTDNKEHEAK